MILSHAFLTPLRRPFGTAKNHASIVGRVGGRGGGLGGRGASVPQPLMTGRFFFFLFGSAPCEIRAKHDDVRACRTLLEPPRGNRCTLKRIYNAAASMRHISREPIRRCTSRRLFETDRNRGQSCLGDLRRLSARLVYVLSWRFFFPLHTFIWFIDTGPICWYHVKLKRRLF